MGEVIQFPDESGYERRGRYVDASKEPATVIILPVVRVERATSDDPTNGQEPRARNNSGRRRRRRAAR